MPSGEADLEVVLRWNRGEGCFDVSLAYDDPADPYDRRDLITDPVRIDEVALDLTEDEPTYGAALSSMLFAPDQIRSFFIAARAGTEQRGLPLHLRILVDPRAPRSIQSLRWESLRDPEDHQPRATRAGFLLSRYLTAPDWRKIAPPPRHDLRALVVIANPSDLARHTPGNRILHRVDVAAELDPRAPPWTACPSPSWLRAAQATLDAVLEH